MRRALGGCLVVVLGALSCPGGLRADEAGAVAWVMKVGGKVSRDEKRPGRPVVGVSLSNTKVTDSGLKELAQLKGLQWMDLRDTKVTDAGLKELATLKALRELYLSHTRVTDSGLKELAHIKGLQVLLLNGTKVTDAGLKDLAALMGLRKLDLGDTGVTKAGVAALRKALPACEIVR